LPYACWAQNEMQTCMLLVDLDALSKEETNQEPEQEEYVMRPE